jgi:hypothetical protein
MPVPGGKSRTFGISSRSDAPAAYAVDPRATADPAGLTARARPRARPEKRAANLTLLSAKQSFPARETPRSDRATGRTGAPRGIVHEGQQVRNGPTRAGAADFSMSALMTLTGQRDQIVILGDDRAAQVAAVISGCPAHSDNASSETEKQLSSHQRLGVPVARTMARHPEIDHHA